MYDKILNHYFEVYTTWYNSCSPLGLRIYANLCATLDLSTWVRAPASATSDFRVSFFLMLRSVVSILDCIADVVW